MNLQDAFLAKLTHEKAPVTVTLATGEKLAGMIAGFDPFCILLATNGGMSLLYKHAVTAVAPQQQFHFTMPERPHRKG